jgi:hypothetical protein
LLLLLTELFHEVPDLLAFSSAVAHEVIHQASRITIVVVGRLTGALVIVRASTPTSCYRSSSGSGSTSKWLVVVAGLLLVLVLVSAALSSDIHIRLASLPRLWGGRYVLGTTLCGSGAFVHQAEELGDVLNVMHGELL